MFTWYIRSCVAITMLFSCCLISYVCVHYICFIPTVSRYLTEARSCLDALLNPKVTALPGHIQAVFVQNIVKLYASVLVKAETEVSII